MIGEVVIGALMIRDGGHGRGEIQIEFRAFLGRGGYILQIIIRGTASSPLQNSAFPPVYNIFSLPLRFPPFLSWRNGEVSPFRTPSARRPVCLVDRLSMESLSERIRLRKRSPSLFSKIKRSRIFQKNPGDGSGKIRRGQRNRLGLAKRRRAALKTSPNFMGGKGNG